MNSLNIIDKIVREYLDRICIEFEDLTTGDYTLIACRYSLYVNVEEKNWTKVAKDLIKCKYPVKVKISESTNLSFLIEVYTPGGMQAIWDCDYKVNFWLMKR